MKQGGRRIEGHLCRAASIDGYGPRRIGVMALSLRREGDPPPMYGELIRTLTSEMGVCLVLLGGCIGRFEPKSTILSWLGF